MNDFFAQHQALLIFAILTIGSAVMVSIAILIERLIRQVVWQRMLWQMVPICLIAFFLAEISGFGNAFSPRLIIGRTNEFTTSRDLFASDEPNLEEFQEDPEHEIANYFDDNGRLMHHEESPGSQNIEQKVSQEASKLRNELSMTTRGSTNTLPNLEKTINESHKYVNEILDRYESPAEVVNLPVKSTTQIPTTNTQDIGKYLYIAWSSISFFLVLRIIWLRLLLLLAARRLEQIDDSQILGRVADLSAKMNLLRQVKVVQGADLASPIAFGFFRLTIGLPGNFIEKYDTQEQDVILAHELAHLAAYDWAWQTMADIACAVLWWQPLVWLSRRKLRNSCEAAADEASLLIPQGPEVLASCLVALGRSMTKDRKLGFLGVSGSGFQSTLGLRVQRLLNMSSAVWKKPKQSRLFLLRTVFVATLVVAMLFCTAWARPGITNAEGETTMKRLQNSWRHSLAATALIAMIGTASGDLSAADDAPAPEGDATVSTDVADDPLDELAADSSDSDDTAKFDDLFSDEDSSDNPDDEPVRAKSKKKTVKKGLDDLFGLDSQIPKKTQKKVISKTTTSKNGDVANEYREVMRIFKVNGKEIAEVKVHRTGIVDGKQINDIKIEQLPINSEQSVWNPLKNSDMQSTRTRRSSFSSRVLRPKSESDEKLLNLLVEALSHTRKTGRVEEHEKLRRRLLSIVDEFNSRSARSSADGKARNSWTPEEQSRADDDSSLSRQAPKHQQRSEQQQLFSGFPSTPEDSFTNDSNTDPWPRTYTYDKFSNQRPPAARSSRSSTSGYNREMLELRREVKTLHEQIQQLRLMQSKLDQLLKLQERSNRRLQDNELPDRSNVNDRNDSTLDITKELNSAAEKKFSESNTTNILNSKAEKSESKKDFVLDDLF